MEMLFNMNGNVYIDEVPSISVLDRGFLYGDSVYEVLRGYEGKFFKLTEHLRRLFRSASALRMQLPWSESFFAELIYNTITTAGFNHPRIYFRMIITRGTAKTITMDIRQSSDPQYILMFMPLEAMVPLEKYAQGISLSIVHISRSDQSYLDPTVKSGNYLNSILAHSQAIEHQADDGIMCNKAGYITEGPNFNVFLIKDKQIYTPALESGILDGITRSTILFILDKHNIPYTEALLTPEDVMNADGCFITSTLREVVTINRVDSRIFPKEEPTSLTNTIRNRYRSHIQKELGLI